MNVRRVREWLWWFGFGAAVMGAGLGAFSCFFASRTDLVPTDRGRRGILGSTEAGLPDAVGTGALVVGATASILAFVVWLARTSGDIDLVVAGNSRTEPTKTSIRAA